MFDSLNQDIQTSKSHIFAIARLSGISPKELAKAALDDEANVAYAKQVLEVFLEMAASELSKLSKHVKGTKKSKSAQR